MFEEQLADLAGLKPQKLMARAEEAQAARRIANNRSRHGLRAHPMSGDSEFLGVRRDR